ncbi:MAG: adenosylcobinamide-GDP ribazoletransferase [Gammaproteobacteria bacterium]
MPAFVIALQFLTRIPIRSSVQVQGTVMGRSVLYYPLVGLLIGLILALLFDLLAQQSLLLSAAILLAVWVLITGGLHLDGLADSADAWAGGLGDKERSLEIMKDPRSGALAIVVLILTLLLKYSAIVAALEINQWQVMLIAPVLGRSAIVLLFLTTPYVRERGLGSDMARYLPHKSAWLILLLVSGLVVYVLGVPFSVVVIVTSMVVFWLLRHMMLLRIGGMTGDTAGSMVELVEVFVLVAMVM